jgi:cysteine synthase A
MSVLDAIGNTPLVELRRLGRPGSARVLGKLEWANPTGSMKDRMALAAIAAAEADGRLPRGGTVVEYTGGTTGVSLAFVCAAKGYKLRIVFSDAFSGEKALMMKALGAEISVVPSRGGGITEALIKEMIEEARAISRQPRHWWSDQLNNRDAIRGYYPLGEEIWTQTAGDVEAFVHVVGTAHSIHGTTAALWKHNRSIHIVAVEPTESAVLSGGRSGAHNIEGIGIGFTPPLWERDQVNEVMTVSTGEAKTMARRLAREEGIFGGTSSGANVVAALRIAERLGPKATVATIIVDSGSRYLSGDVFRAEADQ